jgi:BirA family biotin operon repressor/biotin-[acetyl-CoA-carboxylase] ligase
MSAFWRDVRVVARTGSTNADVAALARAGEPEGLVLVALHQTAGRGRLGRTWTAPVGSGLTFSVLLRPPAAARRTLLPLLAGVCVATAVARVGRIEVALKWPNDVLADGDRKLGGILAEAVEPDAVVLGVGLNVALAADDLPVPTATSLAIAGASTTDRDAVLAAVLDELADRHTRWCESGAEPDAVLAAYRPLCRTLGRQVRAELPGGRVVEGVAEDVADDGSLLLVTPAGDRVAVFAGDVVHLY